MMEPLTMAEFPACHDCARFGSGPADVCLACASPQLSRPGSGACPACSQFLTDRGRCPNELCRSPLRRIGTIHAIGYQAGALRRVIRSYKYSGTRSWSVVLGRLLLAWLDQNMAADPPGLIVANPTFTGAGCRPAVGSPAFAHTEAVLRAAAAADGAARWPFDTSVPAAIIKTRPTLRSADGQAWSKRASGSELRDAVCVPDPSRTRGAFILVFDDICTTGGQLDAIASCLLDEGRAARVEGVVLARAPWRNREEHGLPRERVTAGRRLSASSGSGPSGAVGSHIQEAARELQRREPDEPGCPSVALAPLPGSSCATAEREQNEADAEMKAPRSKARGHDAAKVSALPRRDQAPQSRAGGSGVAIWRLHQDASMLATNLSIASAAVRRNTAMTDHELATGFQ
jgi:predicted amidophosphoribosyltransferase